MDFIIGVTWIITLGEGAQNRPWVLETPQSSNS